MQFLCKFEEGRYEDMVCVCNAWLSFSSLSSADLWSSLHYWQRRNFSSLLASAQCEDLLLKCQLKSLTTLTVHHAKGYLPDAKRRGFGPGPLFPEWHSVVLPPFKAIFCMFLRSVLSAALPKFALNPYNSGQAQMCKHTWASRTFATHSLWECAFFDAPCIFVLLVR